MERKLNDGKVIIKDNFWKRLYGVGTYFENFSDASKEYLGYAIEDTLYKLSNEPNIERTDDNFKDIIYSCNFNAPVAFSSGNYYGNATRKAVEEMVSELDDADEINDLYNQEIQMGNGYRWSVNFKFDYGEYPDYPEDGYVLYADFIDGLGNKHKSDNTAFITMNDDEDTIEKKVSRFMDSLKFSDINELKEPKTIKEAIKVPSSAKRKGQNLIKGIEELYRISETKPNEWLQMYDENDWSFLIKDFRFNEKSMMFTWKEKKDSTRADNSVSNEKEKFINNGEFDFYGEYNDFVNYWNKLVRKTKKYYEMDSRELDRKLGYDVDDELEESKKVVKESMKDYEQAKNDILDAYRNLDEEDLSYVQQIKELCEKAEKLYNKLEPTDEESKIIWDEIDPSGYTGYEEQLVDMIIAIDILLSLRKGTFKNSKSIKEEVTLGYRPQKIKESKKIVKESKSDEEYRKRTFKTNMESIEDFIQKADSINDKVIESLASAIRVSRYYSEDKYDEEFKDLLDRLRKIYEIFKGNGEELYDLVGDISYYIQNNITEN